MSETRTFWIETWDVEYDPDQSWRTQMVTQIPIPWCTTHDKSETEHWAGCEISTGGPDHKWWKDT